MKRFRLLSTFWAAGLLIVAPGVRAQQNAPHLGYVYPAGGRQGSTLQIKLGGQFLANATEAYLSGGDIQAKIIEYTRPMNPMQATKLRERVQELQKGTRDAAALNEIAEIRQQLAIFNISRRTSPVLAENVTLQITIPESAAPGERELRLATPQGLSNPMKFYVGRLSEISEPEPVINLGPVPGVKPQPGAGGGRANAGRQAVPPAPRERAEKAMPVTLPVTVNGQIRPVVSSAQAVRPAQQFTPGNVDRYRFQARQGEELVIVASARELIPYLADAVPGWIQATLSLSDADGKELAYDDDYRFRPDPVLHYVIPEDGEYTVEIKDALYRGREDFVYRIHMGELPYITGIFPLGGRAGARTQVSVAGWNLPGTGLEMDCGDKGPGIYPISVRKGDLISNDVPFMVDTLPEQFDKESNDSGKEAQPVSLPISVNGRIDEPGDWDVFRFEGHAGEAIVAEVYARRLDSPLDSILRLTDSEGRQLALNDDHEDKASGLNTHHADSLIQFRLTADGTYYLFLGDAQQKGGPEYAYRLRLSAPRPDFELRVTPSGINAAAGMTVPLTVYALRKDGFSGDISLALRGAPRGYFLSGAVIPAGQDHGTLTLTAPLILQREPLSLVMEGRATIQGLEVVRQAVPAEDMMQAFAYHHLVPAQDLKVMVPRRSPIRSPQVMLGNRRLQIPAGGTVRIPVRTNLPPNTPITKVEFELSDPPPGIELVETSQVQNGMELLLRCDAAKAPADLRGNLIVIVTGERAAPQGNANPAANRRRIPLGTLPAIPFEIVKR